MLFHWILWLFVDLVAVRTVAGAFLLSDSVCSYLYELIDLCLLIILLPRHFVLLSSLFKSTIYKYIPYIDSVLLSFSHCEIVQFINKS